MRPVREDEQQFMEYYLPTENDVAKVDEVYANPLDEEKCQEIRSILEQSPDDAAAAFEVSKVTSEY